MMDASFGSSDDLGRYRMCETCNKLPAASFTPGARKTHTHTHTHAAALHVLSHAQVLLAMRLSCVYIQNGGFFLHLHSSFLLLSGGNVGDTPSVKLYNTTALQRCLPTNVGILIIQS